jgi:dipeptidyl-peptidase-4
MDGFNHIYLYDLEGNLVQQLTSGEWVVKNILGYDARRKLVYFTAAKTSPLNTDLYSVDLSGKLKKLSEKEGSHSAQFSKSYDYYICNYSSVSTPPLITVNNHKGKSVRVLAENDQLLEMTSEYNFSKLQFFSFTTDDNVNLNGWKILPHNFDPSRKYPVLMYVYGGPGSQTVLNRWSTNVWYQYLAQEGFIIASVDNRGTGSRGEAFTKVTYRELGKYETADQIEAAKYLTGLDYVDSERIAIWGWSYGGYMSSLCITKGADYFDLAIAVAPVTNWRYYDNIYTERYMRTPQENPDGYDDNSPINHLDKLEGKYLIIHGTGDDNVHVQNTIDMVTALVEANKQFDLMLYPNKNHGIYGGNTRNHLYRKMTDFLMENFKGND